MHFFTLRSFIASSNIPISKINSSLKLLEILKLKKFDIPRQSDLIPTKCPFIFEESKYQIAALALFVILVCVNYAVRFPNQSPPLQLVMYKANLKQFLVIKIYLTL